MKCLTAIVLVMTAMGITGFAADPPTTAPATQPATTPEVLTRQLADAIEARDKRGMYAVFGVDPARQQVNTDALWVPRILAVLRLRDTMKERFGADTTLASLKDSLWLAAPDIPKLRATQWTVEGNLAHVTHERNEDDDFRITAAMGLARLMSCASKG